MSIDPIGFVPEWTLADRLRKVRRMMAPCSQAQFAEMIGVEAKAYSQWEAGNNGPRNLVEVVQKISEVTGVSSTWLLGLNGSGTPTGKRMGNTTGQGRHLRSIAA